MVTVLMCLCFHAALHVVIVIGVQIVLVSLHAGTQKKINFQIERKTYSLHERWLQQGILNIEMITAA